MCVCVCVCASACACVCVCVCASEQARTGVRNCKSKENIFARIIIIFISTVRTYVCRMSACCRSAECAEMSIGIFHNLSF